MKNRCALTWNWSSFFFSTVNRLFQDFFFLFLLFLSFTWTFAIEHFPQIHICVLFYFETTHNTVTPAVENLLKFLSLWLISQSWICFCFYFRLVSISLLVCGAWAIAIVCFQGNRVKKLQTAIAMINFRIGVMSCVWTECQKPAKKKNKHNPIWN